MVHEAEPPTVAEIDLAALRWNYHVLTRLAAGAEILAVVKADGYGHGAVEIAGALAREGCKHFGVATLEEASALRQSGRNEKIYLLAGFFPEQSEEIVALGLTPLVFDRNSIRAIGRAAAASGRSGFPVHLKLDTGATRLGVRIEELKETLEEFRNAPALALEGAGTLLANAGDPVSPVTDQQLAAFRSALETFSSQGFALRYAHVANSAATILRHDSCFNLVRPGLALYGLPPVPGVHEKLELRPVMTFKTRVMQVKRVPAGAGVSYGHTFVASKPSLIGVLRVGYADGYRRGLQHGGEVLIRGRRAPVVGAVCMDLTMVDLTDVPGASVGDEAILWGGSGEEAISVNDVARLVHTISYEMLCTVGKRVPRVYRDNG
jgi:alanine racemase